MTNKKRSIRNKDLHKYLCEQEGVVAVEFGMVSILFLTFTLGTIEGGRVLWAKHSVQNALESTTRYVLVHSTVSDEEIQDYARARLGEMYSDSSGLNVEVDRPTRNGINLVRLTGTYSYTAIIPFLPASWSTMDLSAESEIAIPSYTPSPTLEPEPTPEPTPDPTGEPDPTEDPEPTPEPTTCEDNSGKHCCPIGHSYNNKTKSCE